MEKALWDRGACCQAQDRRRSMPSDSNRQSFSGSRKLPPPRLKICHCLSPARRRGYARLGWSLIRRGIADRILRPHPCVLWPKLSCHRASLAQSVGSPAAAAVCPHSDVGKSKARTTRLCCTRGRETNGMTLARKRTSGPNLALRKPVRAWRGPRARDRLHTGRRGAPAAKKEYAQQYCVAGPCDPCREDTSRCLPQVLPRHRPQPPLCSIHFPSDLSLRSTLSASCGAEEKHARPTTILSAIKTSRPHRRSIAPRTMPAR